ncbi:MAG: type II toxin-antitoxin system RelE/ParE family toxin [Methanosarcinales archaeon]
MKVIVHPRFERKYNKLRENERERIKKKLKLLEEFPFIKLDIKKLRG